MGTKYNSRTNKKYCNRIFGSQRLVHLYPGICSAAGLVVGFVDFDPELVLFEVLPSPYPRRAAKSPRQEKSSGRARRQVGRVGTGRGDDMIDGWVQTWHHRRLDIFGWRNVAFIPRKKSKKGPTNDVKTMQHHI